MTISDKTDTTHKSYNGMVTELTADQQDEIPPYFSAYVPLGVIWFIAMGLILGAAHQLVHVKGEHTVDWIGMGVAFAAFTSAALIMPRVWIHEAEERNRRRADLRKATQDGDELARKEASSSKRKV